MSILTAIQDLADTVATGLRSAPPMFTYGATPTAARIIVAFRDAGATSPSSAQRYRVRSHVDENVFRMLLHRGIIRRASPGRYYLDERGLRLHRWWLGGP